MNSTSNLCRFYANVCRILLNPIYKRILIIPGLLAGFTIWKYMTCFGTQYAAEITFYRYCPLLLSLLGIYRRKSHFDTQHAAGVGNLGLNALLFNVSGGNITVSHFGTGIPVSAETGSE